LRPWLITALVAVSVLTSAAFRRRQIMRDVEQDNGSTGRYVDIGVTLRVVRADPGGSVLIPDARTMSVLREYHFGGILDTAAVPPRIVPGPDGISKAPQIWHCSEDQERLVLHRDDEPIGKLALGGMGAGKTTAGVIWLYLRWLENLGTRLEIGITAPTETRLSLVFNELFRMWPSSWWRFNSENKIATLADGFRLRGVSTHRQSQSQGSRVQAFNWIGLLADELQDSIEEFVHMMARLRSKADGKAKRIATATAKDFPEWRTLKGTMLDSGDWMHHSLLGPNSPFVHPDHWQRMQRSMTERDYRRLVLAEDLPSESRLYHTFDRKQNVRAVPFGARRITSIAIGRKTGDRMHDKLVGHDPGAAKAATVWLDAYELTPAIARQHGLLPNELLWWVRGELFTLHATVEQHALQAIKKTRDEFGCNIRPDGERAHVRTQPLGSAEDKPDLSTLATWKRIGFDIRVAQYAKNGQGIGQIKKESRIGVVNTLWCDATGRRRLFIECDDRGAAKAPLLLSAIETMERDDKGRAERDEKDVRHDKSDLPAALGYALWPFEKELAVALRDDIRKEMRS
jgi:hypothetical protein